MVKKADILASELHTIVAEAPDLAPSTRDKYLRDLNAFVEFAGADPADWTPSVAQAFYGHLLKQMKPQSANRLMASVAYASKWWAHYQKRAELDFAHIRKGKSQGRAVREQLTMEDTLALLGTCDGSPVGRRDFAIMVLGLETGMRRMSLAAVKVENFADKPYPSVRVPMKGRGIDLVPVPLSDTARLAIEPWASWLAIRKGYLFRALTRRLGRNGFEYLVDRKGNEGLSESTIYKMIQRRGASVGLNVHPHLFRHTFVTWRTNAGFGPHEVAAVTGHSLNIGALGHYIDLQAIGEKMRTSTPAWLAEFVRRRVQ